MSLKINNSLVNHFSSVIIHDFSENSNKIYKNFNFLPNFINVNEHYQLYKLQLVMEHFSQSVHCGMIKYSSLNSVFCCELHRGIQLLLFCRKIGYKKELDPN